MVNNTMSKKPSMLSPTLTTVLAIITLLAMYLVLPVGDSDFYITAAFMMVAVVCVIGAAVHTGGIKGYGYPKRITLQVVAWRYFLTQFIVGALATLVPLTFGWGFKIEMKRYLITHLGIFLLFAVAAALLVSGKRKMDEAKMQDLHILGVRIQGLRERVRALVAGKEQRTLPVHELDNLYAVLSAAQPIYSESLAYVESELKKEIELLAACVEKLADGNDKDIELLARICKTAKGKIQEREDIIQKELAQMEDEE